MRQGGEVRQALHLVEDGDGLNDLLTHSGLPSGIIR